MPIDGKCSADVVPAHQLEADVVDKADRPPACGDEGGKRLRVRACVNPLDVQHGKELVAQRPHSFESEPPLRQRDRLDEHVVVREQGLVVTQERLKCARDRRMGNIVAVEQRV